MNRELVEQRAKEYGIPDVYTDAREMINRNDIDVIDVCTRGGPEDPDNHEKLVFAALEADKHVLCEKPVAHDYRDTWRAHRLAESRGL
jgi:predicted dehydrogenase